MEDQQRIVERYIATFNETDATRRRELLTTLYTGESTYTDPQVDLRGLEEIDGFIAQTQEHFPGLSFRLGGAIDAHHNQVRFQWRAGSAEAPDQYVGFDVIVTDDGRIRHVYGFMDAAPAAA
jgi:SnoaL-like domain